MDFILCNSCFSKPNQVKIFLTSCGHLCCDKCRKNGNSECCRCKKQCQFEEINSKMRPDLMELLRDPKDLAETFMKEIKNVISFQEKQRTIFNKFRKSVEQENDLFNIKQNEHSKVVKETELVQSELNTVYERIKSTREKKSDLLAKYNLLKKQRLSLETKSNSLEQRNRIEKISNNFNNYCPSTDTLFSSILDETPSNFATSTPISSKEPSHREYLARTFTGFQTNPSPICKIMGRIAKTSPSMHNESFGKNIGLKRRQTSKLSVNNDLLNTAFYEFDAENDIINLEDHNYHQSFTNVSQSLSVDERSVLLDASITSVPENEFNKLEKLIEENSFIVGVFLPLIIHIIYALLLLAVFIFSGASDKLNEYLKNICEQSLNIILAVP